MGVITEEERVQIMHTWFAIPGILSHPEYRAIYFWANIHRDCAVSFSRR